MSFKDLREKLEKAGTSMTDISLDGALPQGAAQELMDMMVANNDFLAAVSEYRTDEHEQPLDFFQLASFVIQNTPEGADPASYATAENIGKTISLKEMVCYVPMLRSIIVSARGKKAEARLATVIPTRIAANIVEVGFKGVQRLATATAAADIAVGWIKLIKDSVRTNIVDAGLYMTGGVINWSDYLTAIIAALPDDFKSQDTCEIVMKTSDYEAMVNQLKTLDGGINLVITGNVPTFGGYKIRKNAYIAAGHVLFTNLKNLCYGINNTVNRTREYDAKKRQVDYMYAMNNGYQIGIDEAIVLGYDVTPGVQSGVPVHLPQAVTFTDTDTTEGELGGTVAITKATDESDITHYAIWLGTGENTPVTELATLPKTGGNLTFLIPANTAKGANTHLIVYAKNATGLSTTGYALTLTDVIAVPANAPAGVAFTDTDTDTGKLGGDIVITKASSETDVTHYVLYFGTSTTVKTTEIAQLPKSGSNITFTLPAGTAKGSNTHILAYTKNAGGLCATPANVAITDVTE